MTICFDLDGTICTGQPYVEAVPVLEVVELINHLSNQGHVIKIYTARGMGRNSDNADLAKKQFYELTVGQLEAWQVQYNELIMGKPSADIYIDDKALVAKNNWVTNFLEEYNV